MNNINEYNRDEFQTEFIQTEMYAAIEKDFDLLVWDKHLSQHLTFTTPREILGHRIGSLTSFYYINKLLEKNPENIYDIGCGWNMFKKYIPNVVGISPDSPDTTLNWPADDFDFFDYDFVANHQNQYDAVMAICSLNYVPLSTIRDRVIGFISIVKEGGRGYIALDPRPMLDRESPEYLFDLFGTEEPSTEVIDQYIREQLTDLPCNILIFDVDSTDETDELDGLIRIVFEN